MRYQEPTFTLPCCNIPISDLEYALRVGNITEQEYEQVKGLDRNNLLCLE